jgi:hypothetical protein
MNWVEVFLASFCQTPTESASADKNAATAAPMLSTATGNCSGFLNAVTRPAIPRQMPASNAIAKP